MNRKNDNLDENILNENMFEEQEEQEGKEEASLKAENPKNNKKIAKLNAILTLTNKFVTIKIWKKKITKENLL